jgi:4-amino-4-deoxy-L-arabinose transferase-like glycosyltransferase
MLLIIVIIVLLRFVSLGMYPLLDPSESRYAEVSREMASSGDWITPTLNGEAFMAKPPLTFWLTALSLKYLGRTEFAARIPSFAVSLVTLALTFWIGRRVLDTRAGLFAALILLSMPLYFVLCGSVVTDPFLGLCTTMVLGGLLASKDGRRTGSGKEWRLLLFSGLGLGLLAKGPVSVIIPAVPLIIWTIWTKSGSELARSIRWGAGLLITLLIALPWYLLMEWRNPGYLDYFILGENILRYFHRNWQGDLYGTVHLQPMGTIWLYWLLSALPWSIVFITVASRKRRVIGRLISRTPFGLLGLWAASPLMVFTFSRGLLATYVYPGLPALALITAWVLRQRSGEPTNA